MFLFKFSAFLLLDSFHCFVQRSTGGDRIAISYLREQYKKDSETLDGIFPFPNSKKGETRTGKGCKVLTQNKNGAQARKMPPL